MCSCRSRNPSSAALLAILADRGLLDVERAVTDYVPELAESGYAGATVRHLLDMRSGVRFREEYSDPHADIRRLDKWIVSGARRPSEGPRGLYPFLTTLRAEAPHGTRFLYRSSETDVLGWVCERAAGRTHGRTHVRTGMGADGCRARCGDLLRHARHSCA